MKTNAGCIRGLLVARLTKRPGLWQGLPLRRAGLALVAPLLLASCASTGTDTARPLTAGEQIEAELEAALAPAEPAAGTEVPVSLMPALRLDPEPAETRFDVRVDNMPSDQFFRSLVEGTDYNMVVHPAVNGAVTLALRNVTLTEVMDIMRDTYGYDYTRKGNLFQVLPDSMRTEVFQVDYINLKRVGSSETQVSAGKVSDAGGSNNVVVPGFVNSSDSGASSSGNGGSGSVIGTRVNTDTEADFWDELGNTLGLIVGDAPGSQVVITPQAGLVVVRALPGPLRAVADYLDRAEINLRRQVILEAKILEVTLRDGFQAGIDWHTFGEDALDTFDPITIINDETGEITEVGGSRNSLAAEITFGADNFLFNPIGSTFEVFARTGDFEGVLRLLGTQGNVRVLSSPRISTVNNQKAVIKVGSDEFFVTDISTNVITAGNSINENDSPELTPFFSGIALDVTPQVSESGEVILHIHPTVSEVTEQTKVISGNPIPLAASTIRESDSIVSAKNGQIIVIGGLMQTTHKEEIAQVPVLGNIPLFGKALFAERREATVKSELVILLKPTIVEDGVMEREIGASLERIRALQAGG